MPPTGLVFFVPFLSFIFFFPFHQLVGLSSCSPVINTTLVVNWSSPSSVFLMDHYSRFPAAGTATTTATTTVAPTPLRPSSPVHDGDIFSDDHISPTPPINYLHGVNYSRPQSTLGESSGIAQPAAPTYFRSRRVRKGEVQRPWLARKDPKEKWVTIIPVVGLVAGLILAGLLVWDGLRTVVSHKYEVVLDENFSSGSLDPKVWTKEVEVGGFGFV